MLKVILYALLAWFLYNLIFKFIIPIYRASRTMKKQFSQMQQQFQQQQESHQSVNQGGFTQQKAAQNTPPKKHSDDYIEFEEIK